jgi:hypothetical protein
VSVEGDTQRHDSGDDISHSSEESPLAETSPHPTGENKGFLPAPPVFRSLSPVCPVCLFVSVPVGRIALSSCGGYDRDDEKRVHRTSSNPFRVFPFPPPSPLSSPCLPACYSPSQPLSTITIYYFSHSPLPPPAPITRCPTASSQ